jgi:neopullulanase
VRTLDLDGWRMDVVRYIDHDFWIDLRREIRAIRPDVYLLAEVMGDARRWLMGDEFDATMNYTFRELCVDYFALEHIDTPVFLEGLLEMTAMYSPAVTAMNHNLLGSHDMPRFLTVAGGDERSLLLATVLQLTLPGAPGLYYGDEVPMAGGADPANRGAMEWARLGGSHHRAVADLVRLRRDSKALQTGSWRLLAAVGDAFVYERRLGDEPVVVAINRGRVPATLPIADTSTGTGTGRILWSVGSADLAPTGLTLGPRSGAVCVGGDTFVPAGGRLHGASPSGPVG